MAKKYALMQLLSFQSVTKKSELYTAKQAETNSQTEQCLKEYLTNLQSCDTQLKKLSTEREQLTNEVNSLRVDQQAKFKLLGTCLIAMRRIDRLAQG